MRYSCSLQVRALGVSLCLHAWFLFALDRWPLFEAGLPGIQSDAIQVRLRKRIESPSASLAVPASPPQGGFVSRSLMAVSESTYSTRRELVSDALIEGRNLQSEAAMPVRSEAVPVTAESLSVAKVRQEGQDAGAVNHTEGLLLSSDSLRQYRLDLSRAARRFRFYPQSARAQGWEGIVELTISVAPLYPRPMVKLKRSSGHVVLDDEAQRMAEKAVQLTPLPDDLQGKTFVIPFPVWFNLQAE